MFNLAIRWEITRDNPAASFLPNPETPRERFLDLKEIGRLSEILCLPDRPANRISVSRVFLPSSR
jgi:hypothetical protein